MNTTIRQSLLAPLAAVAALLAGASTASADVFRVPEEIPDLPTAMAKARDFDLILLGPGIYDGFVWGDKLITIRSVLGPTLTWVEGGVIFAPAEKGIYRCLDGVTVTGGKDGVALLPGGGAHIINCMLNRNDRFGVWAIDADLYIENSVIAENNQGWVDGGGIHNEGGVVRAINLTIAGNSQPARAVGSCGAGICDYSTFGQSTYANCVVWDNGPAAIIGNASFNFCNSDPWQEGFCNVCEDPSFVDAGSLNFALRPGSPCIDAGDNLCLPAGLTMDIACHCRCVDDPYTQDTGRGTGPLVDIGAYEYQVECSEIMLTAKTSCPQAGQIRFDWTGASPKSEIFLIFADRNGPFELPGRDLCAGAFITIRPPAMGIQPGIRAMSDGLGRGYLSGWLSESGCGMWTVLLDRASCASSNAVRLR